MRPGTVFVLAGVLLAGLSAVFAVDGVRTVDGVTGAAGLAAAAAGGVAVALWAAQLLQRHGPLPGRVPLLLLVTAPLWSKLPADARAAVSGAYAGYFAGLVVLVSRRAGLRRV